MFTDQRKKAEKALDDAFTALTEMEIQKEKGAVKDYRAQMKKESIMYRQNIKELNEEKRKEDIELARLLEEHKQLVLKQQQDAHCKVKAAKDALQRVISTKENDSFGNSFFFLRNVERIGR